MIAGRTPSLMWIIRSAGSILAHADKRGISRNDGSRGMGTDTAKAWFEEGRRRQGAGDAAGAVEAYRRSLDLFPAAAGPATNLAGLLADANRLEEAEAVLRRTARAGGADLPLLLNLGEVLRRYDRVIVPEMNLGQLNMLLRAKSLVDTVNYNQVRGLPFKTDELAGVITDVLASL